MTFSTLPRSFSTMTSLFSAFFFALNLGTLYDSHLNSTLFLYGPLCVDGETPENVINMFKDNRLLSDCQVKSGSPNSISRACPSLSDDTYCYLPFMLPDVFYLLWLFFKFLIKIFFMNHGNHIGRKNHPFQFIYEMHRGQVTCSRAQS